MECKDVPSCISEISAYCSHDSLGHALLVNVENYTLFKEIKQYCVADENKECVYLSKFFKEDIFPDFDTVIRSFGRKAGTQVLIGLSQGLMFLNKESVQQTIRKLINEPIRDHKIILLDHCEMYLRNCFPIHPDIEKRVVLMQGDWSKLINLQFTEKEEFQDVSFCHGLGELLNRLENLDDAMVENSPYIPVVTQYPVAAFKEAIYSVKPCDDAYETLRKQLSEIQTATEKSYGTEEQWKQLAQLFCKGNTFSMIITNSLRYLSDLNRQLRTVFNGQDEFKKWLLWLTLKIYGYKGNLYLQKVMTKSSQVDDLIENIYMTLLDIPVLAPEFDQCYNERKSLIGSFPEQLSLLDKYCEETSFYQKEGIYYLTDGSEKEKLAFTKYLEKYDYTEDELEKITSTAFPSINAYLTPFAFDDTNTKVPSGHESLRSVLNKYFHDYKLQKLTNRIYPAFKEEVGKFAEQRPYNLLPTRSSILNHMQDREEIQPYFFDALGVEYLGFIQNACKELDLISEISIGRCILPSITSCNKDEFVQYFPPKERIRNIKDLDELKHHSKEIDYQQCKEPVYIFRELEIIDKELRKIQNQLVTGSLQKAVILSDHGASRLAVISEHETDLLELEEKGMHSGRCCKAAEDPEISYATYTDDGYVVLANYDRIKGCRKANVEVHGGASLEEVLVPVITLQCKPKELILKFINPTITIKAGDIASITLYSNIPLENPKLVVNEVTYQGHFEEDHQHIKFTMPELRRTKNWTAIVYDRDKRLADNLEFRVQKGTQENVLFKKKLF